MCSYAKAKKAVARTWWKDQCNRVLENTDACYSSVYLWISDGPATLVFFVVAGSVAFGIWVIRKGPLETGFYFLGSDYELANFILTFLPVLWFQLMNNYWYLIDIWYRQLQPYMGLRQPSPATENLLLCYPCDLPVQITLRALGARHWRLALTSIMPLIQRVVPILARSLLTVETITAEQIYHISIATAPFKAIFGILCAYLFLIPITWPGLDRRLPITPVRIADSIVMFYESTLVRKDAFLPLRHDEQRWHMKYRLCLEERLYGFGIYPGRNGAQHLGIDDVYDHHQGENKLRIVTPLKPPMRPYRRWLKRVGVWSYDLLHIKRQPTLNEEELEVLQKPKVPLKETVSEQAFPSQDRQAAATVEEHLPVNREGLDVGT